MFEKASRIKLRFATPRGLITAEDLWDLSLTQLNSMAKELNRKLKAEAEEDFLAVAKKASTELKLGFDIVLHVLTVKKAEADAHEQAADKKAKKEKLLAILAEKQDTGLRNLSEAELKAQIEAL